MWIEIDQLERLAIALRLYRKRIKMSGDFPRTEEEIAADYVQRRSGLLKALTDGNRISWSGHLDGGSALASQISIVFSRRRRRLIRAL